MDSGGIGAQARLFAINVLDHPFLESLDLVIGRRVYDDSRGGNGLLFGQSIQLVEGDEDLGRTGVENIDEVSGRGKGGGIDVDVQKTKVLADKGFSRREIGGLDQDTAKVGDLLERQTVGGGGGVEGDKEGSRHGGSSGAIGDSDTRWRGVKR